MKDVLLCGQRIKLDPRNVLGSGGEADVYRLGTDRALKVWKGPDHPDFVGDPARQQAAAAHLAECARKLRAFPGRVPVRVVRPEDPATDLTGARTLGYAMRLVPQAEVLMRYGDRAFRSAGPQVDLRALFLDLHETVTRLHHAGIVIGDFNDLNVLVTGAEAHLIDADSFQFGSFLCPLFTTRFIDPRHCDSAATAPLQVRPHDGDSDWYAFTLMLMQSMLFVGPWGGVYKPADPAHRVPPDARPLRRVTVFHPEVKYPKPAQPLSVLPDDVGDRFRQVFERDQRGAFPRRLLEDLRWNRCGACGTEHGRPACPVCARPMAVPATAPVPLVRGALRVIDVAATSGRFLAADWQDGRLRWLESAAGRFLREDGRTVAEGAIDPRVRFLLRGDETWIARDGVLVHLGPRPERLSVDVVGGRPACAANASATYWTDRGALLREGASGPETIGQVLEGQSRFWVGPRFGFGFYRAGGVRTGFLFDAARLGLNDAVSLPSLHGTLVDADCVFSQELAWLALTLEDRGRLVHRVCVYRADGRIEATADGDSPWLSPARGRCAAGDALFVALDDGITRLQARGGTVERTRDFPETEPFVDSACRLLPGPQGIHVLRTDRIQLLQLA